MKNDALTGAPWLLAVARVFERAGEPVYLVGGAVRNPLMGLPLSDVDVCGPARPERVMALCEGTEVRAVLRAALIGADAVLLAKNVDGVYSADPKKDPNAVRFDSLTYEEVLEKRLAVMDSTATCIAMDNRIPIKVFALREPENILRAARGEAVGTLVH